MLRCRDERTVVATLGTLGRGGEARENRIARPDRRRRNRVAARKAAAGQVTARGLIIGAPRSGSGKTSVTIGLLRALKRRGLRVRGAKSGPDYIDPGFHAAATGSPGVNLDSWAMPPALIDGCSPRQPDGADIVIIESAMGLFDGIPAPDGRSGSAAELARRYGLPVLLVLDVSGQSQTAAAVAKGFATFDPAVQIAGVVLNRLGSERHRRLAGDAIEALGLPVVGAILRDPSLTLPERHLGLVQAERARRPRRSYRAPCRRHGALARFRCHCRMAAIIVDASCPLFLRDATSVRQHEGSATVWRPQQAVTALPPPGQRIALAQDAAFTFLYPHLAAQWRAAGAEIVPFSPLADEAPITSCDVCWLPGGYPELHAGQLAALRQFPRRHAAFRERQSRFMASAAASWCWAKRWRTPEGVTPSNARPARPRDELCQAQDESRLSPGARCSPIARSAQKGDGHSRPRIPLRTRSSMPGSDEPLAELADGQGALLGAFGGRRGHVSRHLLPCDCEGRNDLHASRHPRLRGFCLTFFTRLPLPHFDLGGRTLAQAIWAAPIVGLGGGRLSAGLSSASRIWLGLCHRTGGGADAGRHRSLVTGCLHEDGLSDTADGFGGGKTREQALEIMRDSRIGAFGACAIGLSLLLRWSALCELADAGAVLSA